MPSRTASAISRRPSPRSDRPPDRPSAIPDGEYACAVLVTLRTTSTPTVAPRASQNRRRIVSALPTSAAGGALASAGTTHRRTHTVGEGGHLDDRRAHRGRKKRCQRADVRAHRGDVGGDGVQTDDLLIG